MDERIVHIEVMLFEDERLHRGMFSLFDDRFEFSGSFLKTVKWSDILEVDVKKTSAKVKRFFFTKAYPAVSITVGFETTFFVADTDVTYSIVNSFERLKEKASASALEEKTCESSALYAETTTSVDFVLSDEQIDIYRKLENSHESYFVTGEAGTGKSAVLRYFCDHTSKKYVVLAPTGIAAINVCGETIHSFFELTVQVQDPSDARSANKNIDRLREKLCGIETIIIDEISMVRVDVMDMIDCKLRTARRNNLPFGGCQMILFGDLLQLPPVIGRDNAVFEYLSSKYHTSYFFGAPAITKSGLSTLRLTRVFRQNDPCFIELLNKVRVGDNSMAVIQSINDRCVRNTGTSSVLTITPTNAKAKEINENRLSALSGTEHVYSGIIAGEYKTDELPTDAKLHLKIGAQIIMLVNDRQKRWVNGTIGTVSNLGADSVSVAFSSGFVYSIEKFTWSKYKYVYDRESKKLTHQIVGEFTQYPIKLAYAITIHKSQGQTYDSVCVDYSAGRAFSEGQTYVALSRCRSFDDLYLRVPLESKDIIVNSEALAYMNGTFSPQMSQEVTSETECEKCYGTHIIRSSTSDGWVIAPFRSYIETIKKNSPSLYKLIAHHIHNSESENWCVILDFEKTTSDSFSDRTLRQRSNVQIPDFIDDKLVVGLGGGLHGEKILHYWLYHVEEYDENKYLTSITLPDSLLFIDSEVLYGCPNLHRIVLPKSFVYMKSTCWKSLYFSDIVIPGSYRVISKFAFSYSSMQTIRIEEGVERIEDYAFSHVPKLQLVYLPNTVSFISENSFLSNCDINGHFFDCSYYASSSHRRCAALFVVHKDSYAYHFVKAKGYRMEVID